jgi:D-alanyl-lipoteichoic acid acyltransferase DltB (MBOAT superfamily)
MLFPTIEFGAFFALVFPATWALNGHNRAKKLFLVLCSFFFYACWRAEFTLLLLASACVNFAIGLALDRAQAPRLRKLILIAGIAFDLGLLGYFKYFNFLSAQVGEAAARLGLSLDLGETSVALPVAISFLTFHGISYIVDVYRRDTEASRDLVDITLYMSFYPHLVAGPIVRAADFLAQLSRPSDPNRIDLGAAAVDILGGLFKKVIIASHLATLFVDPVFAAPAEHGRLDLALAVYAYAIVIYCDFSAYTDMARGFANLLGYRFPANFDQPYRASSLQDFWRRWHITLSSFLRDYLYVPLGGSRGGAFATCRNMMIVMTLGGLWHGAGLQFLAWGAMHGAGLVAERGLRAALSPLASPGVERATRVIRRALVFHFVCAAWVFFRAPNFAEALDYFQSLVEGAGAQRSVTPFVVLLMAIGVVPQLLPPDSGARLARVYDAALLPAKIGGAVAAMWIVAVIAPAGVPPFIYFQF